MTKFIRQSRNRSKYLNINENGKISVELTNDSTSQYHRNYVRFRKSSSRSRSRDNSKSSRNYSFIDYRQKLIFLFLQILVLFHLCSVIYFHLKQSPFTSNYILFTLILFNVLTYISIRYDTRQAEYGSLLLGENIILFLIWYGGLIGGYIGLIFEKHKHLRSQIFTSRLRFLCLFNAIWLFLVYISLVSKMNFYL